MERNKIYTIAVISNIWEQHIQYNQVSSTT